jgi:CPA1 family monovalent cation:H+ antiporter
LISPTDPIAALAILKAVGLPKPLEAIINGESLFNDGVGVVLFTVAMAFAAGSSQMGLGDSVTLFLREVLGGITLGLALALSLSLPHSPEKLLILNMTFGVVVFSILAQGSTIGKLFKPAYLNSILKSD